MKSSMMKKPLIAIVLGSSLLAASSFAQTSVLSTDPAEAVDVLLVESTSPGDVNAAPVAVAAVAFMAGALASEWYHHHYNGGHIPIEINPGESVDNPAKIDTIFDP